MKTKGKKLLITALCLIMVVGLVPSMAFATDNSIPITEVTATMSVPVVGGDNTGITVSVPANANYTAAITMIYLTEAPYPDVTSENPFIAGKNYAFRVTFYANDGYVFEEQTTYKINGKNTGSVSSFNARRNAREIRLKPSANYTLTFETNNAQSVSSDVTGEAHRYYNGDTLSILEGTKVWFLPAPSTDYRFVDASIPDVEITKSGSYYYFIMPNRDITLKANFTPKEFGLTFDPNGGVGTAYTEQKAGLVTLPTTTTFTAPTGKQFVGWSQSTNGEIITQIQMTSAKTVYAIWEDLPGCSVSGTLTAYGDNTNGVTIQLIEVGLTEAAYEVNLVANSTAYEIENVLPATYTMRVSKVGCVTREYAITVGTEAVTQNVLITVMGDVNMDGKVNSTDALMVQRNSIGSQELDSYQMKLANPNNDSNINTTDALWIQRKSIGL